ncbi:MAG: sodium:proton antiporter [Halarsenatibacteraceae bacterium]
MISAYFHPNLYYFASIILFLIGFYILLTHPNLIKKVIGLNVMDSAIFFFFVAVGFVSEGQSPIVEAGEEVLTVNPVPSGLMLTGIVVSVSVTAFALAIIIKLYEHYGTINVEEIYVVRSEREC